MGRNDRDFVDYIRTKPVGQKAFDTLNIFCATAICSSIFGLGTKSSMDSPLLDMARKVVAPSLAKTLKITLVNTFPTLFRLLKLKVFVDYEDFFIDAMKKVLRARELDSVRKHDFADLCLELQRNGTMKDATSGYEIEPTDELMAAQAFFFIIAGVEPSATAMFFVLFEMAKHPEMLKVT
ncbi:Cytochrome P450 6a9 [Eumeta japonica]|uniref:unspecific monooxygenase n=1 Tax=Eumeta variegata TaxID=151549 RepID=A0A4C2A0E4_EUMVA|nr:Cytochrome P450 6a9 [Eumeta japonica]